MTSISGHQNTNFQPNRSGNMVKTPEITWFRGYIYTGTSLKCITSSVLRPSKPRHQNKAKSNGKFDKYPRNNKINGYVYIRAIPTHGLIFWKVLVHLSDWYIQSIKNTNILRKYDATIARSRGLQLYIWAITKQMIHF